MVSLQHPIDDGLGAPGARERAGWRQKKAASACSLGPAELRDRLWALCNPRAAAAYSAPWSAVASDLETRLAEALARPGAFAAAAQTSRRDYAACMRTLAVCARPVHSVLLEVRGLALTANREPHGQSSRSAPVPRRGPRPAPPSERLPGEPLVYGRLDF
jgi:hypothetical protein